MFTGEENHEISLEEASEMTRRYRESITPGEKIGGFFGQQAIKNILKQDGCVGFRYYYGKDADMLPVLVLVGVNADGNDLVDGKLAEVSWPCPSYCSTSNSLNS